MGVDQTTALVTRQIHCNITRNVWLSLSVKHAHLLDIYARTSLTIIPYIDLTNSYTLYRPH